MKSLKYLMFCLFTIVFATACNKGIDPITQIAPGDDVSAPVVTISYPTEGTLLRVKEDITSLNINFNVTDDIEIQSISVKLDGTEIKNYASANFTDYRIVPRQYLYDNVTNGDHTLNIIATDASGKSTSKSVNFKKAPAYKAIYPGEIFYMPFDGDFMELISCTYPAIVGNPGVATGKHGTAYTGAADAYLTWPGTGMLGTEFTAIFWYKVNAIPDRAGILCICPPRLSDTDDDRTKGFRLFREGGATNQTIKLNVGKGTDESWFDGGATATLNPETAGWVNIAFTISATECVLYFGGQVVAHGAFTGVSWTGCDNFSIGSGAPRFIGWSHLGDASLIDELRIFNRALTQTEIQTIIAAEN